MQRNVVNRMITWDARSDFIAINIDNKIVNPAEHKAQIGKNPTKGRESNSNVENAAEVIVIIYNLLGCRHGIYHWRYGWWNWHWCRSNGCPNIKRVGILTVGITRTLQI